MPAVLQTCTTACCTIDGGEFADTDGGFLGFAGGDVYVDDLTVYYYDGSDWQKDIEEGFEVDANGQVVEAFTHDAAGNLTYDGAYQYTYDAWNRLAKIERAYRDPSDPNNVETGATVGTMEYDGLGRRVVKVAGDSDPNSDVLGDW